MSYLEIRDLGIDLGEFELKDINLSVEDGEYVTIIGPTGSGKTILLETALGFHKPEQGTVRLQGRDITDLYPEKRGITIVYQDYALFPHMNVFENIAYGLRKRTDDDNAIRSEVYHITSVLEIDQLLHRKPATLSGGEMQRVALARGLIIKPKVLFLDEPFSALDIKTKEKLRRLVKNVIREYRTTVLHVTHDFDDTWNMADRVIIMKDGRILQQGRPEDVFNHPSSDFVADFVGTNILQGRITAHHNGMSVVKGADFELLSHDHGEIGDSVKLSIRPEDIIISTEPLSIHESNQMIARID
ncbi:MAG: ATP-binding cassette domain-containing protein, partial [Methanosarcinaceae archaeon]|nr:ATP-binding cassette domain-containing protein [Methanosarcinaceae archaeon]